MPGTQVTCYDLRPEAKCCESRLAPRPACKCLQLPENRHASSHAAPYTPGRDRLPCCSSCRRYWLLGNQEEAAEKKGQQARKNRKLVHLNNDGDFFLLGDKSVFVSLRGAEAHSSYLNRACLWMALDFETWQMLALSKTEVFLTQRKIPQVS